MARRDLLGSVGTGVFFAHYWQQRPLSIQQAWPGAPVLLEPEELAGLATNPDIRSQIVMGETAAEDWMIIDGPVTETFFSDTPDTDWHLAVLAVDRHIPACYELREPFRFLPDWRFDRVTACYAAPGGTRGPDSDDGDLFVLQVRGDQAWSIRWGRDAADGRFTEFMSCHTQPGDLLYVPSGAERYGTATGENLTYEVRFRAPTVPELLTAWARDRADQVDDRAATPVAPSDERAAGDLAAATIEGLRESLSAALATSDAELSEWLARHLTTPAERLDPVPSDVTAHPEGIDQALTEGRVLLVNPASRLGLWCDSAGRRRLFVDGDEVLAASALELAQRLSADRRVQAADLAELSSEDRQAALRLLATGLRAGWLIVEDELAG